MCLPALAQHLGAGPTVVGVERHAEEVAHLPVKVGDAGLGAAKEAALDVTLRREALGEDAQGGGLAGAGRAGDESKAALADELLDPPAEGRNARRDVERLGRHIGGEGVPLQAIKREQLLVHGSSSSSLER